VTDGRTDRQTDGQNYDSQDRAEHSSRGKNDTDSVIASLQSTLLSLVMDFQIDLRRYSAAADRRIAYVRTHARPVGPTVATTVASCEHRIGDRLTMITEEETFRTSEV